MTITPTVGRTVWYYPPKGDRIATAGKEPLAAIVVCVLSDTCVNLAGFDANGDQYKKTSVQLVQPGDIPLGDGYCEWMPYQIGQAQCAESDAKMVAKPGRKSRAEAEASPSRPPDPPGPFNEVG